MQKQTVVVKVQDTSIRTIEFDCEIDIPIEIYKSNNKDALNDFLVDAICTPKKVNFIDIVDSEQLETEIIDFKVGKLPNETINSYTIVL
jgi:RNAse (barnase) inhibitor barstar